MSNKLFSTRDLLIKKFLIIQHENIPICLERMSSRISHRKQSSTLEPEGIEMKLL